MARLRIDLQIEETSPLVRQLIGSAKGTPEFNAVDPDKVVKVLYTPNSAGINEINPGIYYSIPSITTAKEGDTAFSDDGRFFVYEEAGSRWFLWYTFDLGTVKIHTNNTLRGDGSLEDPLSVNTNLFSLKGDINPLLKGVDNGDGTFTFTSVDGNTMFNIDVGDRFVYHIGELRSTAGRYDGERIDVIGYYLDTPGRGGGRFYWDEDSTETDNNGTIIEVTGQPAGRWKRVHDGNVNAYWFGLRGEGTGDETIKLQEFFDHIGGNSYSSAIIDGSYRISNTINVGFPGGGGFLTKTIHGDPSFRAVASTEVMVNFVNGNQLNITGVWSVTGTPTRVYSARVPYGVGVHINNCGRSNFAGFIGLGFRDSVVVVSGGNSSVSSIGRVDSTNVGTGAPANSWTNSLTANWSNKVNSGSPNSTGQRSTITVDTMPDSSFRNVQLCYIEGEYYEIHAKDEINSTISVYPFIPAEYTSGMLVYHYGAAVYLSGADTNVLRIGTIDAVRTGTGIDMTSLYGPNVDRMVIQNCGTAFIVGREGDAAMASYNINQLYSESNLSEFIYLVRSGFGNHNVNTIYEFDVNKIKFVSRHNEWDRAPNLVLNNGGRLLTYHKSPNNEAGAGGSMTLSLNDHNKTFTVGRNNLAVNIQPNLQYNRMFGYDTVWLAVRGSGPNNSPTGVISFQSQRSDLTYRDINGVNSSTPIEYQGSNFPGPALFVCYYRVATDDFMVDPVARILSPSEIGALGVGDKAADSDLLDGIDSTGFATAAQGTKADTAIQPGDLATIATTGDSADLTDSANLIRNDQDTYGSEPKVVQIITLTQAEKDAIVTPVVGALYIVPEP